MDRAALSTVTNFASCCGYKTTSKCKYIIYILVRKKFYYKIFCLDLTVFQSFQLSQALDNPIAGATGPLADEEEYLLNLRREMEGKIRSELNDER